MIESHTAILERHTRWSGSFATEPYEAAWAHEAIFFVHVIERAGQGGSARVEISPDGQHWSDEGSAVFLPDQGGIAHVKVSHFGGWLRLAGETSLDDNLRVNVHLALKE